MCEDIEHINEIDNEEVPTGRKIIQVKVKNLTKDQIELQCESTGCFFHDNYCELCDNCEDSTYWKEVK